MNYIHVGEYMRPDRDRVKSGPSQGEDMKQIEQETDDGGAAPALRRAVRVLDYVSVAGERPTAADLARQLEIPKSTAHGLIKAMIELGLLVRGVDGTFGLGSRPTRWANGFLSQFDLVSVFHEHFSQNP